MREPLIFARTRSLGQGWFRWGLLLCLLCGLLACDDDHRDQPAANPIPGETSSSLRFAGLDELGPYLLAGHRQVQQGGTDVDRGNGESAAPELGEDAAAPAAPDGAGRSEVNVQVTGVDEADLLRSDGQTIFAIARGSESGGPESPSRPEDTTGSATAAEADPLQTTPGDQVRIMAIGEPATSLTDLGRFDPGEGQRAVHLAGLYLHDDELIMLGSEVRDPWTNWYAPNYWSEQITEVYFADVSDPASPLLSARLSFQGGLVDSRVVANTLYLITRYYPPINDPDAPATSADASAWLPGYRGHEQADYQPLEVEGCFVEDTSEPRSSAMIAVIAIALAESEHPHQATCYAGEASTLYGSTQALYLAAADFSGGPLPEEQADIAGATYGHHTLVHKFAFDALAITYHGSGMVPGSLADNPREAAFRFSEAGDDLRVVTESPQRLGWFEPMPVTDASGGAVSTADEEALASPVLVTILRDTGPNDDLDVIASLPNEQRPEVIGLRGEQLYASRYVGDTLYVVTFRTIDPLYVIDLSDPADPYIAGSLKIEGFSDYLHPVREDLLLGIGKAAQPAAEGDGDARGAWYQGLQVALFDVSDPQQPAALERLLIGERGSAAAVLHNHLAFAGRPVESGYRAAFGASIHGQLRPADDNQPPWQWADFSQHGLLRLAIDLSAVPPQLHRLAPLVTTRAGDQSGISRSTTEDRALLIDDAVHCYHDGHFWSQDWAGNLDPIGPQ